MNEENQIQIVQDNVRFKIEPALVGKEVKLKKSSGERIHYSCPSCGNSESFDLNDIRIALTKLYYVEEYASVAKDLKSLKLGGNMVDFLSKRARIKKKHEHSLGKLERSTTGNMELPCSYCGGKTIFNVTAEPDETAKIPPSWLQTSGRLSSELMNEELPLPTPKMDEGGFFEVYENDDPAHLIRLESEGLELLEIYTSSSTLSWKKYKKLVHVVKWTDKRGDKTPLQLAEEFAERLKSLSDDINILPSVNDQLKKSVEEALGVLKTNSSRYALQKLLTPLYTDFQNAVLRKLRRQLTENLLWLNDEIERIVGLEKTEPEDVGGRCVERQVCF